MTAPPTATPQSQDFDIGQMLAKAQAHWQAGQADQAEIACQRVLAVWPGQCDAMHLLGLMAHAYGNLDLAISHLRQACMAPRAPALYFSDLAEMCRQRGLLTDAEQFGRQAVTLNPNLYSAWNNLGIILQESGKLEESRDCLIRVVSQEPENARAINNLGNTCKRLGLNDEAERHWRRAAALQPDFAEVYSNLANLFNERAQHDQARQMALKAIGLNPRLADAYINIAAVEAIQHQLTEAQRWLRALLSFAPDHVGGLTGLAMTLKQTDDLDAAAAMARRAVAVAPQSPEAQNALGAILMAQGQEEAALSAFDRAASLPGLAREQSRLNRAALQMEMGRKDLARADYQSVLEEFPNSVGALFNLASLNTVKPGDPVIARMAELLRTSHTLSYGERMTLHFGLAKALMDVGDGEAAFTHLDEGNRLKRASIIFDPDMSAAWVRAIGAAFPAETLTASRRNGKEAGGDPSSMPIFVLGMPRSGTTLVEQILASHPLVHGAGELHAFQQLAERFGPYPDGVRNLTQTQKTEIGADYVAYITKLANGRPYVVDKMPSNFLYIGLIRQVLPQAHIIHCRRDPADTCLSCYSNLFAGEQPFTYDQTELGRFYRSYQDLLAQWRPGLPAEYFLEIDYESVVEDLEREARRLLAFLGLPWDPAVLDFHRTKRAVRTASVNQVRQPIYRSSAGKWRKFAPHMKPLLTALGIEAG